MMKEYMVHFWGGAMPTIEKELGITERYKYFKTEEERSSFIRKISKYKHLGLMIDKVEGELTHKETIVNMDLVYKGKVFNITHSFGYEYPQDSVDFMFFDGNYSCDCNKSIFIREQYGDEAIEELDCGGDEIQIENFKFI